MSDTALWHIYTPYTGSSNPSIPATLLFAAGIERQDSALRNKSYVGAGEALYIGTDGRGKKSGIIRGLWRNLWVACEYGVGYMAKQAGSKLSRNLFPWNAQSYWRSGLGLQAGVLNRELNK
ncbi:uncharacterized protein MCYG_04001 [Microsporum canis CBS 113480]|uniref:Uncharacterized protein n=1 Tax=Arthroderma otae (strain ATCC MYA-4605 / CBS 113480) TaxID=554155 RepID=C5FMU6_ARTOC|nr:uncharacterized protein MCYG_04001 [Microsporum canis CBS 113480]EEQ31182.1 predicted protein [Microsporum canis CBS 113480]